MKQLEILADILATYRRHEWQVKSLLLCEATRALLISNSDFFIKQNIENVLVHESEFDAVWFARAAQEGREAWELRFISENAYALFEMFEVDEAEEDRADVRREMEANMRERVTR